MTAEHRGIPVLQELQDSKYLTVNLANAIFEALISPTVEGITSAVPSSPQTGQKWIVGDAPDNSGVFGGHLNEIAIYITGGVWRFIAPENGMILYLASASFNSYRFNNNTWAEVADAGVPQSVLNRITANDAKVGVSQALLNRVTANDAKVGVPDGLLDRVTANDAKVGVSQTLLDTIADKLVLDDFELETIKTIFDTCQVQGVDTTPSNIFTDFVLTLTCIGNAPNTGTGLLDGVITLRSDTNLTWNGVANTGFLGTNPNNLIATRAPNDGANNAMVQHWIVKDATFDFTREGGIGIGNAIGATNLTGSFEGVVRYNPRQIESVGKAVPSVKGIVTEQTQTLQNSFDALVDKIDKPALDVVLKSTVSDADVAITTDRTTLGDTWNAEIVDHSTIENPFNVAPQMMRDNTVTLANLRANWFATPSGWSILSSGTTTSTAAGPGSNSPGPYFYYEASSPAPSVAPALMLTGGTSGTDIQAWLAHNGARNIEFLYNYVSTNEGGGAVEQDAFFVAEQLDASGTVIATRKYSDWGYLGSPTVGQSISLEVGGSFINELAGGWRRVGMDLMPECRSVRLRNIPETDGSGHYINDLAFYDIKISESGLDTPSDDGSSGATGTEGGATGQAEGDTQGLIVEFESGDLHFDDNVIARVDADGFLYGITASADEVQLQAHNGKSILGFANSATDSTIVIHYGNGQTFDTEITNTDFLEHRILTTSGNPAAFRFEINPTTTPLTTELLQANYNAGIRYLGLFTDNPHHSQLFGFPTGVTFVSDTNVTRNVQKELDQLLANGGGGLQTPFNDGGTHKIYDMYYATDAEANADFGITSGGVTRLEGQRRYVRFSPDTHVARRYLSQLQNNFRAVFCKFGTGHSIVGLAENRSTSSITGLDNRGGDNIAESRIFGTSQEFGASSADLVYVMDMQLTPVISGSSTLKMTVGRYATVADAYANNNPFESLDPSNANYLGSITQTKTQTGLASGYRNIFFSSVDVFYMEILSGDPRNIR